MPRLKSIADGLFRALRSRNYKLFFGGQGISLIGTWMTQLATSWLVYRLARDSAPEQIAFLLGLVGFAGQLPMLVLSPVAGVIADRCNKHRLLIVTQVLSMFQSAALGVLALLGVITIPQVIWLSVLQGLINAFDMPARQAFLVEIVENRDDLPNAIALNSSMFNSARLLGPALAGVLISQVGEAYCFLADGASYLAVIAALLAMRLTRPAVEIKRKNVLKELKEGFGYSFGFPPIRAILLLVGTLSFMLMPFMTLLPIVADRLALDMHGARMLGFLRGASGLGALVSSIYLASRETVRGLGRVIVIACGVLGVGLIAFSQSPYLWLSMLAMFVSGVGMIAVLASCNTIIQTIVEDDKRGRVMSFYGMAVMGAAPLGSLASGWSAQHIGESPTILISGAACMASGLIFAFKLPQLRELIRPIYRSKGIIPEVAEGLQSTAGLNAPPEG